MKIEKNPFLKINDSPKKQKHNLQGKVSGTNTVAEKYNVQAGHDSLVLLDLKAR